MYVRGMYLKHFSSSMHLTNVEIGKKREEILDQDIPSYCKYVEENMEKI